MSPLHQPRLTAREWRRTPEAAPMPGEERLRAIVTPADAAEREQAEPAEVRGAIRPTTDATTPPAGVSEWACRHCDRPETKHGIRYAALAGWHGYEPSLTAWALTAPA
ncbi:hypothetical protein GCM10023224_05600 [Streptomonospora halophila]|uniref:Uncharacterized protein n=1 Tax=Streptomonospora halophila TaxID=427369 RepID=A0ABP9G6C4_9ACTN